MANSTQDKKETNPSVVNITVNSMKITAVPADTILSAAKKHTIAIPHFCYDERLKIYGACRMCVVELEGARSLVASCSTPVKEGMIIRTHSPRVLKARRTIVELLLANHDLNCPTCKKNLNCILQQYASDLMLTESKYIGSTRIWHIDNSSPSISRNSGKCILCGKCVRVCNDIQTVYAIGPINRGFKTDIAPNFNHTMAQSSCVNCGQCVVNCPTAALTEKSDLEPVIKILDSGKHVIVQVAPSIRATIGECFGLPAGTPVQGKLVSALKSIGFAKVFDTDLAADITIVEEATEFVHRFKENKNLPLITTCCPAWIKFGEQFYYKELVNHMSTCRSPQAIFGKLAKTYYAQKMNLKPEDIVVVDVMPCTAKKYEIQRAEFKGDVDYVITTIELAKLINEFNVDFVNLPDSEFDDPLGESTGAATIFGRTGGVMEAALRTAADLITGKDLKKIEYRSLGSMDRIKEAEIELNGKILKIAVVHTLGEARKLLDEVKEGKSKYHFIEIMACYGGCIGGGGQPNYHGDEVLKKRAGALNIQDENSKIRKSHQNKTLQKIYKEFVGEFGSDKAHELFHTKYVDRSNDYF